MADNSILTPGYQEPECPTPINTDIYLEKDNYLSEYISEEEKALVRENLNIPSKDSVFNKQETNIEISKKIREAIQEYLNTEDPHGIIPIVEQMIEGIVKQDGSTPFNVPQSGKDPLQDSHLTTKRFVNRLLKEHIDQEDPHNILPEVLTLLEKYVKTSDIYGKQELYTKQELTNLLKTYVKRDGTVPFIKPQVGVDPTIDSHLSTKRYVDNSIYEHLVDVDPHGFLTILNQRLSQYSKKKDVFDKTQTYSRTQIDSIISKIVESSLQESIQEYIDSINDKFEYIRKQKYIKQDGSIPFTNPQSGVDAVEQNDLVTLRQLLDKLSEQDNKITNLEPIWRTSGPVESTVGHVEDNTEVPETMTFQEIMDAIFYGLGINIYVPKYIIITEKCPVTLCIHGSTGLIDFAELWQDDKQIYTFSREDFQDGCITVDSESILKDTTFTFKVYYTNDTMHEVSDKVKVSLPVFVGLLPKWKFGNYITIDYLQELANSDIEGTQNQFLNYGEDVTSISFNYKFIDADLRHPFIVIPESYPELDTMITKSQSFGIEAFNVIDMIPLKVAGRDIIYKIYIYKQALSSLNQEVTFNFKPKTIPQ